MDRTAAETSKGLQLGRSNVFALLGVQLDRMGTDHKEQAQTESTAQELIHTPTSLFARLRQELKEQKPIYEADCRFCPESGQFIEFTATLRRNPWVEFLEA